MKTIPLALGALGLILAACAPVQEGDASAIPNDGPDRCMADRYQSLIGLRRNEIPQPPAGAVWRVTCTTCPVTMDYNPRRLNVFYDEQTRVVREVRCG